MAITTQDIHDAAGQLVSAGENPTLAAIRKALGGGSYTTISEAMKEWKAKQQNSQTEIREAAPESITNKLNALGADVWAVALELANSRLQSEREALEQVRAELEAEAKEAAALADTLNDENEQLKTELEQKNNDLSDALENNSEAEEKVKQLDMQCHKFQISLNASTKATDDLKAEIKQLRQANEEKTLELGKMTAILEQNEKLTQSDFDKAF